MSLVNRCLKRFLLNFTTKWKPYLQMSSKFCSKQLSDFEVQRKTPICIQSTPIPAAHYGGRYTVTMIPGLGAGPEMLSHVRKVFEVMGAPVDFEVVEIDAKREESDEFENALISIRRNGVAIKGNIEPRVAHIGSKLRNIKLRKELDMFVYVLWCKSYPGVPSVHKNVDIVLMRENTEGEYSTLEHSVHNKVVESLKIVTSENSTRLATYAFEFARKYKRKKVTIVHKANIMKLSDGLFLQVCKEVAKKYSDIQHDDLIVDNCCMQIVLNPEKFDVILTTNLYGSIVGNIMCGMSGGLGLFSGKNYGDHYAVFEMAVRLSGVTIAGKNIANPVGFLSAGVDLLHHLGHTTHAKQLEKAIYKTLCEDKIHTPDIGGKATTSEILDGILKNL